MRSPDDVFVYVAGIVGEPGTTVVGRSMESVVVHLLDDLLGDRCAHGDHVWTCRVVDGWLLSCTATVHDETGAQALYLVGIPMIQEGDDGLPGRA